MNTLVTTLRTLMLGALLMLLAVPSPKADSTAPGMGTDAERRQSRMRARAWPLAGRWAPA